MSRPRGEDTPPDLTDRTDRTDRTDGTRDTTAAGGAGRIVVDVDRCIGAAQCVLSAPEIFDQDDDGFVVVLDETPPADRADRVGLAARICPSGAIRQVPDAGPS